MNFNAIVLDAIFAVRGRVECYTSLVARNSKEEERNLENYSTLFLAKALVREGAAFKT